MKTFALMSPLMGRRRDMPSVVISETFPYDCENVVNDTGMIKHADGRSIDWATPIDGSVLVLSEYLKLNQQRYLMAVTTDKIYCLNPNTGLFTDISPTPAPAGTVADVWSTISYNDIFYMTRYTDVPYMWNGSGTVTKVSGGPPKAKYITQFANYVILGYIIDSNTGNSFPSTIEWCDLGRPDRWISGGTQQADAGQSNCQGNDPIVGFAPMGAGYLGILKQNSLHQMYNVSGILVFNISQQVVGVGATAGIVTGWDALYFYGTNQKFWRWDGSNYPTAISDFRIEDIATNINPNALNAISGAVLEGLDRIAWLVPTGRNTTPDMMVVWDTKRSAWSWMSIPGSCLCPGGYHLTKDDTWNTVTGTWDQQSRKWDTVTYLQGATANVIGSADGHVYRLFGAETDLGQPFTGTFQSQKMPFGTPHLYKRLTRMQHWFKNEGVARAVNAAILKDDNPSFETAHSLSLYDSTTNDMLVIEDSCDHTARTFQLQVSGTQNFQYLGTIFYYEELGTR